MRSIKLTIAYDGTAYCGWQRQPTQPTVQGTLELAWMNITGEEKRITGSSRTDAGVHALGQVASVETESTLEAAVLQRALNAKLPDDIVVVDAADAPIGFDAIRDTRRKRYRYQIHNSTIRHVFGRTSWWHVPQPLDVFKMDRAGQTLVGTHDFASFQSSGSERESSVRTIYELAVTGQRQEGAAAGQGRGGDWITICVEGDGFLYNMVRTIAGSLVEVGRGARPVEWMADVLAAQDRKAAGPTAPPHALFLVRIDVGDRDS